MSQANHKTSDCPVPWWPELFPDPGTGLAPQRVRRRLLSKGGEPFLVLPMAPRLAALGLQLYAGQRAWPRLVSSALAAWLRRGLPAPTRRVALPLWPEDSLIRFLAKLPTGSGVGNTNPPFSVLAGNPSTAGRRFVVLVGGPEERAALVVKAGGGSTARRLIEQEETFLRLVPQSTAGIPRVVDSLRSDSLRAFALPFVAGRHPPLEVTPPVRELLRRWILPRSAVTAEQVQSWNRLRQACAGDKAFEFVARRIEAVPFGPVIAHGDFAPWNLRLGADGGCVALDWERGALPGMPGWDWFHYVIQPALLVQRVGLTALQARLEGLLGSAAFQVYSQHAGFAGREKLFLLAYLRHVVRVLEPAEGLTANRELLRELTAAWLPRA